MRATTAAANQLATQIHKVAESSERLTLNLFNTATGVSSTSNAIDQLLTKHSSPPDPKAKPFEIEPYVKASAEFNQAVAGLNNLLGSTDTMIGKRVWAAPAQDVNTMLTAQIDRLFWRALILLGVFFLLLFAYRWANARWLRAA